MIKKKSVDWRYLAMVVIALCLLSFTTTATAGPQPAICCVCSCSNGIHCLNSLDPANCGLSCEEVGNTTCGGAQTLNGSCEDIPACAAGGLNPAPAPAMGTSALAVTAVMLSIIGIWRVRRRQS